MTWLIFESSPWLLPVLFFIVLTLLIEVPFRLRGLLSKSSTVKTGDWDVVQVALFTLASFVLGLSFAQASGRYDTRRELVVKEANAIGTTWLRADQLDRGEEKRFRSVLTDYTAERLKAYGSTDRSIHERAIELSDVYQSELWQISSSALAAHPTALGLSLLMQTLNDTIDVSAEQLQALTAHVPTAIVTLMLALSALAMLAAGLRFARDGTRPLVLSMVLVAASVIVVSMAIDYDRPQTGFITISLTPMQRQLDSMRVPSGER